MHNLGSKSRKCNALTPSVMNKELEVIKLAVERRLDFTSSIDCGDVCGNIVYWLKSASFCHQYSSFQRIFTSSNSHHLRCVDVPHQNACICKDKQRSQLESVSGH